MAYISYSGQNNYMPMRSRAVDRPMSMLDLGMVQQGLNAHGETALMGGFLDRYMNKDDNEADETNLPEEDALSPIDSARKRYTSFYNDFESLGEKATRSIYGDEYDQYAAMLPDKPVATPISKIDQSKNNLTKKLQSLQTARQYYDVFQNLDDPDIQLLLQDAGLNIEDLLQEFAPPPEEDDFSATPLVPEPIPRTNMAIESESDQLRGIRPGFFPSFLGLIGGSSSLWDMRSIMNDEIMNNSSTIRSRKRGAYVD